MEVLIPHPREQPTQTYDDINRMLEKLEKLLTNGVIYTSHARDKMRLERITPETVFQVLKDNVPQLDASQTNRQNAWNNSNHLSVYDSNKNITVIYCESYEHKCLILSVYYGRAHSINDIRAKEHLIHKPEQSTHATQYQVKFL